MERVVPQVVQRYRECRNLLPALQTNLAALGNALVQSDVLNQAVRRRHGCYDSGLVAERNGRVCDTTAVAVAPLGILHAFSPAMTEQLLGQYVQDQNSLLQSICDIPHQWKKKIQQVQRLVEMLEDVTHDGQAMINQSSIDDFTCGHSTAATLHAAFALLSVLIKMGSLLQESALALRKDMMLTSASPVASQSSNGGHARGLERFFSRECTLSGLLPFSRSASSDSDARPLPNTEIGPATDIPPLSLVDAVHQLHTAVQSWWESCTQLYLSDEAWELLTE